MFVDINLFDELHADSFLINFPAKIKRDEFFICRMKSKSGQLINFILQLTSTLVTHLLHTHTRSRSISYLPWYETTLWDFVYGKESSGFYIYIYIYIYYEDLSRRSRFLKGQVMMRADYDGIEGPKQERVLLSFNLLGDSIPCKKLSQLRVVMGRKRSEARRDETK